MYLFTVFFVEKRSPTYNNLIHMEVILFMSYQLVMLLE